MWAHPPWFGRFLSPGNRGRELAEYARWCNAVEGNTTFYATPSPRTVARWAELAPSDFRFAFKVPRRVTHELRLRGAESVAALRSFLAAIDPLGERIGPVQLQLPPTLGPESLPVLASFVADLPSGYRWVVELRHLGWFDGRAAQVRLDDVLAGAGVGRVVLDARPVHSVAPRTDAAVAERDNKPLLPIATDVVGAAPVVRVIGADDLDVTRAGLRAWIPQLTEWLAAGREPYLFVHQPENRASPALARAIHAEVRELVPALAPLPEPLPVAPATEVTGQDTLF